MILERIVEILALWRNPIFVRFCRSRLRMKRAIFWYLLTIIVTTFVVMLTYVLMLNSGIDSESAARRNWLPLLIIQGLIMMVKGTGVVSSGLIQDKIDQTLDYQRLTPLRPTRSLAGYLFGLPVLEYVMFALTIPHLLFVLVVGNIPAATFLSVYTAFFVCVILYHMTGIAVGIVMKRWIVGYLLSIFMVILINVILPTFISQIGLRFIQYLSVWPVIAQKALPVLLSEFALSQAMNNPYFSMAGDVPFYGVEFTAFTFTLTLQGALILTFGIMAWRRWINSTVHSLSKPYALAFLSGLIILIMGNIWPAITGDYLPFEIFGNSDLQSMSEVIAVIFPFVYCVVCWLLLIVLLSIVVPTHHEYVRGFRRAFKFGRQAPRPWEDDSGNIAFQSLLVLVAVLGFLVLYREISAAGFFAFRAGVDIGLWRLPVSFALVLFYTLMLLQVLGRKPAALLILLLWFLPILVAILFGAISESIDLPHAIVAAMSPIALLSLSGMVPLIEAVPIDGPSGEAEHYFSMIMTGVYAGMIFILAQIAWLAMRWRRISSALRQS